MNDLNLLEALRELPTGNLADAMAKLKLPAGVMVDAPRAISPNQPRMAGYARTLVQMPRHQTAEGASLAKHLEVINATAQPGDVLVMDVGGRMDACSGGGLLALRAKVRGLAGFVVNGCYRDTNDVAKIGFPLFCTGTSPMKSSPLLETVAVNQTVVIGGVQVRPGDILVGDDTGIVVLPAQWAADILRVARRIQQVEQRMEHYILQGLDYTECRKKAEAEFPE